MTYDLFGEPVFTAYRHAMQPKPVGCPSIQLSATTYDAIKDESRYTFEAVDLITTSKRKKNRLYFLKDGHVPFSDLIEPQVANTNDSGTHSSALSSPTELGPQQNSINSENAKQFQEETRRQFADEYEDEFFGEWGQEEEDILLNEQPTLHPWTLRFQEKQNEDIFILYYREYVKSYIKTAAAFGFFFISTSSILDALVAPSQRFADLFIIRFAVTLPSYGCSLLVATKYSSAMESAMFWSVLSLGVGQILNVYYVLESSRQDYAFFGLVFVILYGFCCVRLRFMYGVCAAIAMLVSFNVLCFSNGELTQVTIVRYNLSLILATAIGTFYSYDLEKQVRQEWILIKIGQDVRYLYQKQKETSDTLILNVLPEFAAQQLRLNLKYQPFSSREVSTAVMISRRFSHASILVVGIVDFPKLCSRYTHVQLVTLVAELFGALDDVTGSVAGVEKIKTHGDTYVAAAGIVDELLYPNHVQAIAQAAISMQRTLDRFNAINFEKWNFRIGIHSGPCLAGESLSLYTGQAILV
eukprot:TRINITY_DN927_c0_g1_i4.p2 TRINITY_DN927_c0_g1~~TRINITY_DN927_c0_g1_i4.p2  ORF type:complete len:526 (+),score=96.17 TRINITY_DN927_c0_g1_i4:2397-3974(+)